MVRYQTEGFHCAETLGPVPVPAMKNRYTEKVPDGYGNRIVGHDNFVLLNFYWTSL